jgi:SAM-dependent methyltransferase
MIGDAADRACPLCGSRDVAHVIDQAFDASRVGRLSFASRKPPELMHWRLATCASCGLVYASPAPTADELLREYRDAGFDAGEESRYAAATYAGVVRELLRNLPDRAGVLDIGAGDGAFLERLLELGLSGVVGLEPSAAARAGASQRVRDSIRALPFERGMFDGGGFSLVTCLQTIEHLPEPLAACEEAGRLLKRGGALLVVCHDRRAWSARLLGRRSPIYDIEHLQLFDRATLRALLERSGFERVEVHRLVNRYPLGYWLRLARAPAALVRTLGRVASLPLAVPAGNLWAVGYRRRGSV